MSGHVFGLHRSPAEFACQKNVRPQPSPAARTAKGTDLMNVSDVPDDKSWRNSNVVHKIGSLSDDREKKWCTQQREPQPRTGLVLSRWTQHPKTRVNSMKIGTMCSTTITCVSDPPSVGVAYDEAGATWHIASRRHTTRRHGNKSLSCCTYDATASSWSRFLKTLHRRRTLAPSDKQCQRAAQSRARNIQCHHGDCTHKSPAFRVKEARRTSPWHKLAQLLHNWFRHHCHDVITNTPTCFSSISGPGPLKSTSTYAAGCHRTPWTNHALDSADVDNTKI